MWSASSSASERSRLMFRRKPTSRDSSQSGAARHFTRVGRSGPGYDAACTVISEIFAWLLPSRVPSVEIHTSRFDVGAADLTEMVLRPGLSAVAGLSRVVSSSFDGVAEEDARI